MDRQQREWFVQERAKALAMVLLTGRDDLVVMETKEESGLDYTVYIRNEQDVGKRPFGVYMAATMTPVSIGQANNQLNPVMSKVQSYGPFNYPVCVFYFTVKENQGFYAWASEPIVTRKGDPKLKIHSEANCRSLNDESLSEVVAAVNRWYDAFYETVFQPS